MNRETKTVSDANNEVLQKISSNVDTILTFCTSDVELRNFALKFQFEQAAEKAAYNGGDSTDGLLHMKHVLQRMTDLALSVAKSILSRTLESASKAAAKENEDSQREFFHSSSVEDFAEGTEAWLETGAHLSFLSVELLCSTLLTHKKLCKTMQNYMLEKNIVEYLANALSISRDHEIGYFQEGYRTEHMRLIANLSFSNPEVSSSIVRNDELTRSILSGTKIDEENPGMVEWAEFAIRNLCESSREAQDTIRNMTPLSLSEESEKMLAGKVKCDFTDDGKVNMSTLNKKK